MVLGAGNIALTAIAAARALGAGKILVTARHPLQTNMAKRLGAEAVLPTDRAALKEAVETVTDGRGADLTIQTVGGRSGGTLEQAIDMLASSRVSLGQIVTHKFTLDEIQQGFDTAYDKTTGPIKVQINQS